MFLYVNSLPGLLYGDVTVVGICAQLSNQPPLGRGDARLRRHTLLFPPDELLLCDAALHKEIDV